MIRNPAQNAGYTVIELVITLGLVSVVTLAAAQLIAASARVYRSARQGTSYSGVISLTTSLRRDVQGSSSAVLQLPTWDQRPMELIGWDGGKIRYSLDGEVLVRETFDSIGAPTGRRVIANGVSAWWWRLITPQTVEVRVAMLARPGLGASAQGIERNTVQRRFSFRGWPDGRSW